MTFSILKAIYPITFYGGEPLLRFDIIKEAVAYIQAKPQGHLDKFNFTTNGTLLNKEYLDFFIRHDFNIVISLDGPQTVNDRYRVFKNGIGAYNRIMKALALIKSHDRDYFKKKVSISSVFSPPFNDVERILDFFSTNDTIKEIKGKIRSSQDILGLFEDINGVIRIATYGGDERLYRQAHQTGCGFQDDPQMGTGGNLTGGVTLVYCFLHI